MIGIFSIITIAVVNTFFVKSAHKQHDSKEQIGNVLSSTMTSHLLEGEERCQDNRLGNSITSFSLEERKECEEVNEKTSNNFLSETIDVNDDIDMESLRVDTKSLPTTFEVSNYRLDIKEFGFDTNRTQINYIRELWEKMLLEELNKIVGHYATLPQILPSPTRSYVNPLDTTSDIISDELLRYTADAFRSARTDTQLFGETLQPGIKLPSHLYTSICNDVNMLARSPLYKSLPLAIIRPEKDDFYMAFASQLFKSNQVSDYQIRELRFEDFEKLAENLGDERKQKITKVLQRKQVELSTFRDLYPNFRHIRDKKIVLNDMPCRWNLNVVLSDYVFDNDEERIEIENKRFEELRNVIQSLKEKSDSDTLAELGLFLFNCAQLKSASEHLPYEKEGLMEGIEDEPGVFL